MTLSNESVQVQTDICVIGGGSGGLSVAAGAVQMGAQVVLVEKHKMGGDCLNYGCVPSKSLLAAAHKASQKGTEFGVDISSKVVYSRVHKHIHSVIASIAPHDSVKRFRSLGVEVIKAAAEFLDQHTVRAGKHIIKAKYFVIATGSSAAVPPIPGIHDVPFLTNETIFDNKKSIKHLLVIGGGPIGMEMAQAHAQLGSKVTVMQNASILPKDDPQLVDYVRQQCVQDGVKIIENAAIQGIKKTKSGLAISLVADEKEQQITGSHILVSAGRKPNLEGLQLHKAGVVYTDRGINVDNRLRTNKKHIYAIGDAAGGYQFTHVAGYHGGIVIRNILFKLPAKVDYKAITWVTYTSPEMAHVGLTREQAAEQHGGDVRVLEMEIGDNDRARAERHSGIMKVYVTKKGKILGVDMVCPGAGELIQPWCLAIHSDLTIKHMATYMAPYPTVGEVNKRVAGSFYTASLFSDRTRKLVRFLMRWF